MCFTYDLFLNLEGNPPVNHLRCEKLTFNNPTTEFRCKLLMAGGVSVPACRLCSMPAATGQGGRAACGDLGSQSVPVCQPSSVMVWQGLCGYGCWGTGGVVCMAAHGAW